MKASDLKITDLRVADINGLPKHMILLKIYTNSDIVGYGEVRDASSATLEKPDVAVSTKEAYAGITPTPAPFNLRNINNLPIEEWRNHITNDFEKSILKAHPEIQEYKDLMYRQGAVYACMSGSGSAVFGIFKKQYIL